MNISEVQPLYSNSVTVLKAERLNNSEVLVLYKECTMRYIKNGKANMHTRNTYNVEILIGLEQFEGTRDVAYNMTNKAEAVKAFNDAK